MIALKVIEIIQGDQCPPSMRVAGLRKMYIEANKARDGILVIVVMVQNVMKHFY